MFKKRLPNHAFPIKFCRRGVSLHPIVRDLDPLFRIHVVRGFGDPLVGISCRTKENLACCMSASEPAIICVVCVSYSVERARQRDFGLSTKLIQAGTRNFEPSRPFSLLFFSSRRLIFSGQEDYHDKDPQLTSRYPSA